MQSSPGFVIRRISHGVVAAHAVAMFAAGIDLKLSTSSGGSFFLQEYAN